MVTAGIKNIKISGVREKIFLMVASFTRNNSELKNQPAIRRNIVIRIYATGVKK